MELTATFSINGRTLSGSIGGNETVTVATSPGGGN